MIGQQLGPYRIVARLGAGGMGEVYRAHDVRLGRDVAIKLLPPELVADPERLKRFEREAQATASLSHPNILAIFDVGTSENGPYLVAELVEGDTLRQRLSSGPLPIRQVVDLAVQIARGLAAAHEKGTVHRDLKPDNVIVTPDGVAKIVDFGLAKLVDTRPFSEVETLTHAPEGITESGMLLGTTAYMAPEQARGIAVDLRADIFSFGVMLHEMLSGARPFSESTAADTLVAIIKQDPPPLPGSVPDALAAVVHHCLEKRPEDRFQSARDLGFALQSLASVFGPPHLTPERRPAGAGRWWLVGSGAAVVLLATVLVVITGDLRKRVFGGGSSEASPITSLAVLPLKNLMGDPAQDYFVEGMQEALITELSKISALKVISQMSSLRFKGSEKPLPDVARELGADGIIEGSVLREGDRIRVTVQLIHAPTDRHLWAQSFDRELHGVLALHSEVARAIADEIKVTLTPSERAGLAAPRPVDPAAFELYALGRHHWTRRTIQGYFQAVDSFRKALDQDPMYSAAHAALADTYMLLGEQGGIPQGEARGLAAAAIREALEIDDNLAEAHASLGEWKLHYEWDWENAEDSFKRAIALNPSFVLAHQRYGRGLAFFGRFGEALTQLQRARELDPLSPIGRAYMAQILLFARRYREAIDELQRALEVDPGHALLLHNLGEVYLGLGRPVEAVAALQRSVSVSEQPSAHFLAMLGCAYARGNQTEEAERLLETLEERARQGRASTFDVASLHAALGEDERALAWLERGYQERDGWLIELKAWPWFDALLPDPRYQDLLRRVGLPAGLSDARSETSKNSDPDQVALRASPARTVAPVSARRLARPAPPRARLGTRRGLVPAARPVASASGSR